MIVKTEEDPLKEADIMVENVVDHVIMEVWDNKEHFGPLLFIGPEFDHLLCL